jgi:hypothetical protein
MVDVLRRAFGVDFELWDTGGGCTALIGELEGNVAVYITDAPSAACGAECEITPFRDGIRVAAGFAVGVYVDDHATQLAYGEYPTAAHHHLPVIVAEQLAVAVNNRVHGNNSREHIFPPRERN